MIEQTKKILKRYKDNLPLFSLNFKPYLEFLLSSDFLLTQRIYEILEFFFGELIFSASLYLPNNMMHNYLKILDKYITKEFLLELIPKVFHRAGSFLYIQFYLIDLGWCKFSLALDAYFML